MAKNVVRDNSDYLEKLTGKVIRDTPNFAPLKLLRFLHTWWVGEEPERDHEKLWVAASVRKLPTRERDVYGMDVEFRVNRSLWAERSKREKYRLVWHELCHIGVHMNEDLQIEKDADGRVSFAMLSHDIVIKTFNEELERFGLSPDLVYPSQIVSKAYRDYRNKKSLKKEEVKENV